MTTNPPRPTFSLAPDPMLIWNEVSEATSYKFEMNNNQGNLWKKELSPSSPGVVHKFDDDNIGYYTYNYPEGETQLERDGSYLLTAEAWKDGQSVAQGQIEIVLLEPDTQQAVEDFENLLDLGNDNLGDLEEKYLAAKRKILVYRATNIFAPRPWRPGISCGRIDLTPASS